MYATRPHGQVETMICRLFRSRIPVLPAQEARADKNHAMANEKTNSVPVQPAMCLSPFHQLNILQYAVLKYMPGYVSTIIKDY